MDVLTGITPAFNNYNVKSLGWPVGNASVIVPYSYKGTPFPGGVHRDTVPLWNALLDELTGRLGVKLMNPGCWGYNNRSIRSGGTPSFHSAGLALDVSAPANPYLASGGSAKHSIPDAAAGVARSLGMEWGGAWTSPKDYQHFEIHLTPAQVKTVAARLSVATPPRPTLPPPVTPGATWNDLGGTMLPTLREGDGVKGGGDRGRLHWYVMTVQALCNIRGLGGQPLAVDGVFGPATTAKVKVLQDRWGVPVTGEVNAASWPWLIGNDAPDYA